MEFHDARAVPVVGYRSSDNSPSESSLGFGIQRVAALSCMPESIIQSSLKGLAISNMPMSVYIIKSTIDASDIVLD